jgi:excisionase family DNA binding protein
MLDRRQTLTIEEAAALLGVSRGSAYLAAQRGTLPGAFTIGTRRLVSRAVLEAFLATAGKRGDQHKDGARAK